MRIEVGKYYRTRDGRKVGPMVDDDICYDGYPFTDNVINGYWSEHGERQNRDHPETDIIAEWTEDGTGTLAELDVRPGDVVECVHAGSAFESYVPGREYTVGGEDEKGREIRSSERYSTFRIISRASGTPKTWGQMTDAEKVEDLEQLFNKCVKGLVTEEYCNGYMEAIDHMMSRIKPEPVRETVTLWWEQGCVAGRQYYDEATHRITFTTTNGKPDLDSIKMEALG